MLAPENCLCHFVDARNFSCNKFSYSGLPLQDLGYVKRLGLTSSFRQRRGITHYLRSHLEKFLLIFRKNALINADLFCIILLGFVVWQLLVKGEMPNPVNDIFLVAKAEEKFEFDVSEINTNYG
ncbi:MAG: hypothetical protein ACP5JH_08200 [Bacteroidota bacterium]